MPTGNSAWNTHAYQRGNIIGCWLTDLRGGFSIEEHAKATFPFRPDLNRTWERWLQGASRTASERVKDGIWERLPDGKYRAVGRREPCTAPSDSAAHSAGTS